MSTWIFSGWRRAAGLIGLELLAGCTGIGGVRPPDRLAVSDGAVTVAGPPGFCVDRRSSGDRAGGAFVLMASCAALSRQADAPRPDAPAVLTASVSRQAASTGPGGVQGDALRRFFGSEAGRSALARDGRASSVQVIRMLTRDGAFILHARDASGGGAPGLNQDYWRAIFDVGGRIVTASVIGFRARPISDDGSLATLIDFAGRIRAESVQAN